MLHPRESRVRLVSPLWKDVKVTIPSIFGSDRSPWRGNLVCLSVHVCIIPFLKYVILPSDVRQAPSDFANITSIVKTSDILPFLVNDYIMYVPLQTMLVVRHRTLPNKNPILYQIGLYWDIVLFPKCIRYYSPVLCPLCVIIYVYLDSSQE